MSAAPAVAGQSDPIAEERAAAQPEATLLKTYRAYARGWHNDPRTTAQKDMLPELNLNRFCDNVCKLIVQTPANRLTIARFDTDAPKRAGKAILEFIRHVALINNLPNFAAAVNVATLRDGDHAVGLRWRTNPHGAAGDWGSVRLIREAWWNGEQGVFISYDDDDQPRYAVKEWGLGANLRRNVYYPDRIERFLGDHSGNWYAVNYDSDPVQGGRPVPWLDLDGNPLGIPFVHFANRLLPNDGPGGIPVARGATATTVAASDAWWWRGGATSATAQPDSRYGVSELDGGILGLQDHLNMSWWDLKAAEVFTGTQMLWGSGIAERKDATGNTIPYPVIPGGMITTTDPNGRFGHFPAGDLSQLRNAIADRKRAISLATRIPLNYIAGDWPSGEALQWSEVDFAEKVDKFGEVMGPAYASLMHKATRLANAFGRAGLDESVPITTVFTPSQRVNPLMIADSLVKVAGVFGVREAARQAGMQPADIERILGELEQDRQASAAMLDQFVSQGDQGNQGDGGAA
jgi:hypothetical protein